jgi:hypothetical protein
MNRSRKDSPENLRQGAVIAAAIACLGAGFLFAYCVPEYVKAERLVDSNRTARATIESVYQSKGNGRFANYSFDVEGVRFTGKSEYEGDVPYRTTVPVYYLADEPAFSSLEPKASAGRLKSAVFLLVLCIVMVAGLAVYLAFRSRPAT